MRQRRYRDAFIALHCTDRHVRIYCDRQTDDRQSHTGTTPPTQPLCPNFKSTLPPRALRHWLGNGLPALRNRTQSGNVACRSNAVIYVKFWNHHHNRRCKRFAFKPQSPQTPVYLRTPHTNTETIPQRHLKQHIITNVIALPKCRDQPSCFIF
ncbi:hypothetical protein NPIL_435461 [Nephila pilipes]|uniref:Uncharacterized protein n=1 Tax=Nephila pilipes TaxID=299642 RepID=A0A8X6QTC5_NEPPI|nr:hypothetical protein NPIL_435461 [Nephila pilipes]